MVLFERMDVGAITYISLLLLAWVDWRGVNGAVR